MFNFNSNPRAVMYRSHPDFGSESETESPKKHRTRPKLALHESSQYSPSLFVSAGPQTLFDSSKTPTTTAKETTSAGQVEMTIDVETRELASHMALLKSNTSHQDNHELTGTPIFTMPVLKHSRHLFSQYGFIAGMSDLLKRESSGEEEALAGTETDPRLFFNISAPSSAFICGSQGSGKSHTLSCLLENCLMKSEVSRLDNPLSGLVFHYDSFTSDLKGAPCEAGYLSSNPNITVRILCSPTNLQTIKRTYSGMKVQIEPLRINQSDLNTKRMLDLMAVSQDDGPMPLYLHAINRILREMRMVQQATNGTFNYAKFKRLVADTDMTPGQLAPLAQRLDTLESFMPKSQTQSNLKDSTRKQQDEGGNDWTVKPGHLTIVDLSCPCVTPEGACALFNMCLSLFLEQKTAVGRVVALDEAHKYMNSASEATALTNTLLSSIRLQRHLGTRVFISTQEPTISPKLLDLCSFTIVHRFSSPDWLRCLKSHLAALDIEDDAIHSRDSKIINIFNQIVKLRVGEALLFAPSATIGVSDQDSPASGNTKLLAPKMVRLGLGYMKIKIRARITADGGKSVLAVGSGSNSYNLGSGIAPKSSTVTTFGKVAPTISAPVVQAPTVSSVPLAFGTVTAKVAPTVFAPVIQAQAVSSVPATFGAPSPTPRMFEGLRVTAPSVPAVESLKARGTLGLNHTPPVIRKATGPFDVNIPEIGKLVHGTSNSNIFGVANSVVKSESQGFGVGKSAASGINNPLMMQENKKPVSPVVKAETTTPRPVHLSSSIFASPPKVKSKTPEWLTTAILQSAATPSFDSTKSDTSTAPTVFCPGTRSFMFIPFTETEVSNNQTGLQNVFQHVSAQKALLNLSQEELRLADYASAPNFAPQFKANKLSTFKAL